MALFRGTIVAPASLRSDRDDDYEPVTPITITSESLITIIGVHTYSPLKRLEGAWTVKFDPKWGGPEFAEFAELEDWTQRTEEGIKYYFGKATYQKPFDLKEADRHGRVFLDLGEVRNVAEVRLNGKNLGVVWIKPFRVEITGVAKGGKNDLEIDIVNLWPNRLIGDARLPYEKWLTTTNVRKFTKDYKLFPSGLLGPVVLHSAG